MKPVIAHLFPLTIYKSKILISDEPPDQQLCLGSKEDHTRANLVSSAGVHMAPIRPKLDGRAAM